MAKSDSKPVDDSLAGSFEELKRDFMAWFTAEGALLRARVSSSMRRMILAAGLIVIALMSIFVALTVLAETLVDYLAFSLGPITAGFVVGLALLLAGLVLLAVARFLLLKPDPLRGRLRSNAKLIWNRFND
ncbi:hypothetical protein G5V57_29755 [Nordella sp. HKS 07]|uniref:phage holin family protein n=1 Tax=Nordella sp. HKS 07 TaxID=2712222 RepID=UPI0013E14CFD|nr:phage holin family protein [Nordella sp. HKS 07]QIG51531.1 hypothetical protein G5V57_29755 [Nordella sp. HKS 07]